MASKLISLNIEGKRHLDKVQAFLARERAQIVCLMEVCEEDVPRLAGEEYPYHSFAQNDVLGNNRHAPQVLKPVGVAILAKEKIEGVEQIYCGAPIRTQILPKGSGTHAPIVLLANIWVAGTQYTVGAVHFTWTPSGEASDEQKKDVSTLIERLSGKELILAGDFNIPRGNEAYKQVTSIYRDNVPTEVHSTIDPDLHYANQEERGKLALVVDYIFSTKGYRVDKVRVEAGVSDHCALVCTISLV